ncbi:hypothetical protein MKW94_009400 [Papaver nudicaule]|uniref:Uncharacterized protein n=1 Tax=Papaver nudicaule TaxID=74823 RepID=A0AA41VDN8_PAPNU|nr:hypothetical protein [Papaver nudicaule]
MTTFSRIIKKAASSITPLANRTRRNDSSSVLISTPLTKSTISCSNFYGRVMRKILTPTLRFPSPAKKKPTSSDPIICAEEAEDRHTVVKKKSEFPFKIEDKPGEQTITLTRRYQTEKIKVMVHMPADHSYTAVERGDELDEENNYPHKDSVSDPQSSIRLVVSSTNSYGTTLEYGVIAYPDDFSIDSFCIKYANAPDDENIYYKGPDYVKLDKNLQKEFKRRLKIRGIIPSTTNVLHKYMANRDMYSSADSSNSPPLTTNYQYTDPESFETTLLNDEGITVPYHIERYRRRGHPLVSADDIRNSGKNHEDFIWIPYPYTRSEKLLWIEVPSKGFLATCERELVPELDGDDSWDDDPSSILDSEDDNPYRRLPPKTIGDPLVFSEEMDKILYPDLKYTTDYTKIDYNKFWEECGVALKEHHAEMRKIKYANRYANKRKVYNCPTLEELEQYTYMCNVK